MLKKLPILLTALCALAMPAQASWSVDSAGPGKIVKIAQDSSGLLGVSCFAPGGAFQPTLLIHSDKTLRGYDSESGPKVGFLSVGGSGEAEVKVFGYVIEESGFVSSDSENGNKAISMLRRKNNVDLKFFGRTEVPLGKVSLSGSSKAIRQIGCL